MLKRVSATRSSGMASQVRPRLCRMGRHSADRGHQFAGVDGGQCRLDLSSAPHLES